MANKLALTTALLLALVAFATSRYTTVVTTTTFEDEGDMNPQQQQQQRCQSEYQGKQFFYCQRVISPVPIQQNQGGELPLIKMVNGKETSEYAAALSYCCDELRKMEKECRCGAINHAVRQLNQRLQGQQMPGMMDPQEMKRMINQRASGLPQSCNIREPQQCQIRSNFF